MEAFLGSAADRAEVYAMSRGLELVTRLGSGMDGIVLTTSGARRRAVKVHERRHVYRVEVEAYRRLRGFRAIQGHSVPGLLAADDELGVIEMEIVSPPFLLDFGKARLDEPLTSVWPEHVLEERWAHWESLFEPWQWPTVLAIYDELALRFGIFLEDLHPGNIAFEQHR